MDSQNVTAIPGWLSRAKQRYDNGNWRHPQMTGEKDKEKTPIDCSHLVQSIYNEAGINVPYMTTDGMRSPKATAHYNVTPARNDGAPVKGLDVKPGNTVVFDGHAGIVTHYDPQTGGGEFFGSQSHTGPKVTKFGPGAYKDFENPDRFLRPNDSTDPDGVLRRNEFVPYAPSN